jgi:hypothetical protein
MGSCCHIEEIGGEENESPVVERGDCGVEFSQGLIDEKITCAEDGRHLVFQDDMYFIQKAAEEIERDISAVVKERRCAVKVCC